MDLVNYATKTGTKISAKYKKRESKFFLLTIEEAFDDLSYYDIEPESHMQDAVERVLRQIKHFRTQTLTPTKHHNAS